MRPKRSRPFRAPRSVWAFPLDFRWADTPPVRRSLKPWKECGRAHPCWMVLNVSRLKSGDHDAVRQDIAEVVLATPQAEHKVILETCYLSDQEKMTACRLAVEAGADYVKTSTGFGASGATVSDVKLMVAAVQGKAKVKASGGIRDWNMTRQLLEAGADRIGTSASLAILDEWSAARATR